ERIRTRAVHLRNKGVRKHQVGVDRRMTVPSVLMRLVLVCAIVALFAFSPSGQARAQDAAIQIGVVKYGGGGDWYQGQTPLPNLIRFVRQHTMSDLAPQPAVVELSCDKLFSIPFLFLSG